MPQVLTEATRTGTVLSFWEIKEFDEIERPRAWYVIMGIFGGSLLLYSIVSGNFVFSAILILSAIIMYLQSHGDAPMLPFAIAELGIIVGGRFYSYQELDEFYIIYQPPDVKMLYIETKSPFRPLLRIPILDNNPLDIRNHLRLFLPENIDKEEEPTADKLARLWRIH